MDPTELHPKERASPRIEMKRPPPPLPPPPDLAFQKQNVSIRIGEVEVPLRFSHATFDKERRKTTKSGVTQEARRVLDQFLKHSSEHQFPRRHEHARQVLSEREYVEENPYMFLQSNESYHGNRCLLKRDFDRGFLTDGQEPLFFDEPDYAEPAEPDEEEEEEFEQIPETQEDIDAALGLHQHVSKTNSISSQSSFGLGARSSNSASRSRSPSDKLFLAVHPPKIKGRPPKVKGKKHKELSDESSSSTEDYEYTENYLVSRKKKSFFKWASERLRQSFRRSNKLPPILHDPDDRLDNVDETTDSIPISEEPLVSGDQAGATAKPKGTPKKNKLKFNLKRNGSEKGSKSSSTPNEASAEIQTHVQYQGLQEVAQVSESDSIVLRTEDTDQASIPEATFSGTVPTTGTGERRRKSPVPWKRYEIRTKKKEPFPGTEPATITKDKGIFDSFLKHIRKGSSKLKRKGSKESSVGQRSRSADNLTVQPLSKEHEKVLQRYTTARKKETEYDSDSTTVRSFHEVITHRVEQGSLPPLPRPSVVWYPPNETIPIQPGDEIGQPPSHDLNVDVLGATAEVTAVTTTAEFKDEDLSILQEIKEQQKVYRVKPGESEDDVDGGLDLSQLRRPRPRRLKAPPLQITSKPFHERTELEKEELYEKIAEQLAAIADQYNFESPRSSKSLSSPASRTHSRSCSHSHSRSHSHSAPSQSETEEGGATGVTEETVCPQRCTAEDTFLEAQLGALLQGREISHADLPLDVPPMMAELVRNASYSQFKQMFNENIGNEPGWQQIAMMFRLTQTAVQLAGFGTAVALQIKEMTLKYFEDKFAGWIVGQGGWESVVENDSELD